MGPVTAKDFEKAVDKNYVKLSTLFHQKEWKLAIEMLRSGSIKITQQMTSTLALVALNNDVPINVVYFLLTKFKKLFVDAFDSAKFMTFHEKAEIFSLEKLMLCTIKLNPQLFYVNSFSIAQIFSDRMSLDYFDQVLKCGIKLFSPIYERDFVLHIALRTVVKNKMSELSLEKAIRVVRKSGPVVLNIGNKKMNVIEFALKHFGSGNRLTNELRKVIEIEMNRRKKNLNERHDILVRGKPKLARNVEDYDFDRYPGSTHFGEILRRKEWAQLMRHLENFDYDDSDMVLIHYAIFHEMPIMIMLDAFKYISAGLYSKYKGVTPLMLAIERQSAPDIILLLANIDDGLACHIPDAKNMYPLHYAILYECSHKIIVSIAENFPSALGEIALFPFDFMPITITMQKYSTATSKTVKRLYDILPGAAHFSYAVENCSCDNPVLMAFALHHAHEGKVMAMLEAHPEMTKGVFLEYSILISACRFSFSVESVKKIIDWYPEGLTFSSKDDGNLALHYACARALDSNAHPVITELFMRAPKTISTVNKEGLTPFHHLIDLLTDRHVLIQNICREMYKFCHHSKKQKDLTENMAVIIPKTATRESFEVKIYVDLEEEDANAEPNSAIIEPSTWPPNNASTLIKLIGEREWDKANDHIVMANLTGAENFKKYTIFFAFYFQAPKFIVRHIIETHPQCLDVKWNGHYPLHVAMGWNVDADVILYCLEKYPAVVERRDCKDMFLLHVAAIYETRLDIVRAIYDADPDAINIQANEKNTTPLQCALNRRKHNIPIVLFLAERTEKVKCCICRVSNNTGSMTPFNLSLIGYKGHNDAVSEALIRQSSAAFPLFIAFSIGLSPMLIRLLMDLEPDMIRRKMKDNSTLLHYALCASSHEYYEENIEMLLELQPETVLTKNKKGIQPFNLASDHLGEDHPLSRKIFEIGINFLDVKPKAKKKNKSPPKPPPEPVPEPPPEPVPEPPPEPETVAIEEVRAEATVAAEKPLPAEETVPPKHKITGRRKVTYPTIRMPPELLKQIRSSWRSSEKTKKKEEQRKRREMRELFLADVRSDAEEMFRMIDVELHNMNSEFVNFVNI